MERFCAEINASLTPAPRELAALFNATLIDKVYRADEHAFDADILRAMMTRRLAAAGVEVRTRYEVVELSQTDRNVRVRFESGRDRGEITADFAFNCTYSRLQVTLGAAAPFGLKHEISEMVLVEPPPELAKIGVTVMDGPFFSMMPFPARQLHSLSHVRYTPHAFWIEDGTADPYQRLSDYHCESRVDRMVRDAARYLPAIIHSRPHSSLFEVKTVLTRNESDDGRPILLRRQEPHGRILSVLGGKIDNIYDILDRLDAEPLPVSGGTKTWTH